MDFLSIQQLIFCTGYTSGTIFWSFAENAIAIIGACLPTLAPLWRSKSSLAVKVSSHLKSYWKSSRTHSYGDLEAPYHGTANGEHASNRQLVGFGTAATVITTDNIALDDRPAAGIKVQTTFTSDSTKS